jgi:hypothetical protein
MGTMRVGLHALGIGAGARREVIDVVAVAAEARGFATLWAGEHVVMVDEWPSRRRVSTRFAVDGWSSASVLGGRARSSRRWVSRSRVAGSAPWSICGRCGSSGVRMSRRLTGRDMRELDLAAALEAGQPEDLGPLERIGIGELVLVEAPPEDPRDVEDWVTKLATRWSVASA